MIKVVLDTQTAISGLLDFAAPREIILLGYKRQVQLWGSRDTFSEFCRVVRYPRLEKRITSKYLTISSIEHEYGRLLNFCNTNGIEPGILVEADPDDDEFIRVAISANVNYIVSRDHHLLDLDNYASIPIVRPSAFMDIMRKNRTQETFEVDSRKRSVWHVWRKRQ